MSALRRLSMVLILVSACSGDDPSEEGGESSVVFVGLEDGALLGGAVRTVVDPASSIGSIHVDLFLGDDRIGADDLAPYAFDWSTADHAEGEQELRARVELTDGSFIEGRIGVVLDNAAPVISAIRGPVAKGESLSVEVTDAHRVERVELSASGVVVAGWDAAPYVATWTEPCGIGEVTVTAVDEVGWQGTWTGDVETTNAVDVDCDGYEVAAPSSDRFDCDDTNADIFPGQIDTGELGDVNCDGIPGTDRDGDGIAATAKGGLDCDDSDPATHPEGWSYASSPMEVNGETVVWDTATASMASYASGRAIAVRRGPAVDLVLQGSDLQATRVALLDDVNPGAVALLDENLVVDSIPSVFYATGDEIRAHRWRDGSWTDELVLTAGQTVEQPIVDRGMVNGVRTTALVARAGQTLHVAIDQETTWVRWSIDSLSSYEGPIVFMAPYYNQVLLEYIDGGAIWQAYLDTTSYFRLELAKLVGKPRDMAGLCHAPAAGLYYKVDDCLVEASTPTVPVACTSGVEHIACYGSVVYLLRGDKPVLRVEPGLRRSVYLPTAAESVVRPASQTEVPPDFAAPGVIHAMHVIPAAPDPNDGVDRDCNGRED